MSTPKNEKPFWESWKFGPKDLLYIVGVVLMAYKGYDQVVVANQTNSKDIAEIKAKLQKLEVKDSTMNIYLREAHESNKELINGLKEINTKLDEKNSIHSRNR